jgi:hypothetical protein
MYKLILSRQFSAGRQAALIRQGRQGRRRVSYPKSPDWEAGYSMAGDRLVMRSVRFPRSLLEVLPQTKVPLSLSAELGLLLVVLGGVRGVEVEGDQVTLILQDKRRIEWEFR